MNLPTTYQLALTLGGFAAFLWIGWRAGKSKVDSAIADKTVKDLRDAIEARDIRLKDADLRSAADGLKLKNQQIEHDDKIKTMITDIATLQGQINIIKDIPLASIDITMKEILSTLKSSATLLAVDTKDAATAAAKVKTDLASHPISK